MLLAPVAFLFAQLWTSIGDSAATTTGERAAVAYARPVTKLLTALVDVQYAAVLKTKVDPSGVQSAVDDVNTIDRRSADPLRIRHRWTQLSGEINNALRQNASGADALRTYASPIALTQALLGRIADSSKVTHDPGPGSFQLTQVALRDLPEVIVEAGQVSALASTAETPGPGRSNRLASDPRLTIAKDRLVRATADVSTGLRAGTDPGADYAVDTSLLGPLDEFAAASDELSQAADALGVPGSGVSERVDAARTLVKTKALALESAVLDAFDAQLTTHAGGYAEQRRALVLAAVIILLAAAILLWLGLPRLAVPHAGAPDTLLLGADGRHSRPAEGGDVGPDGSQPVPDLVDARDLLPHPVGLPGSLARSQEATGSR